MFFVFIHSGLVLFNLFGWMWRRTRIYNLFLLALTGASWLFLGLLTGKLGYCPFTDWHFKILEKTGVTDLPDSYIKYLFDRVSGLDISPALVDGVTLYAFVAALVISSALNIRDLIRRKK